MGEGDYWEPTIPNALTEYSAFAFQGGLCMCINAIQRGRRECRGAFQRDRREHGGNLSYAGEGSLGTSGFFYFLV